MTYQIEPLAPQADEIRQALSSSLSWSPHDFIRAPSTFFAADRTLYVDQLTQALPQKDDLRFVYRDQQRTLAIFAERLPWDSEFFGYNIARLNGIFPLDKLDLTANYENALHALVNHMRERDITYLFATIFPEDLPTLRALSACGFTLIETRAAYHRPLANYTYPKRFSVRPATSADIPALSKSARDNVNPYDRFHADPFLARADVDRLMVKWIEASIQEHFADVTIVPNTPDPGAFTTVKYHQDKWERWGLKLSQPTVLSAVSPKFQGWYTKLISEANYHLLEIGAEHCFSTTQMTNRAVIHTWEKLGFTFGRGTHIFRLVLS